MRVANTIAPSRIVIEQRPEPTLARGGAIVRVEHVTLCGTDLHIWEGEYLNPFPIVQGHEIVGIVTEIDPDAASEVGIGSRVVVSPVRSCGTCHACRMGRPNVCSSVSVLGCYEDGAFAELLSAPASALHPVPDAVPAALAPLSEPASISLQAVGRGRPVAGELALVIGCGPIGLIATLALRERGVDVVAIDTVAERARAAVRFGAVGGITIDPTSPFPTAAEIAAPAGNPDRPIILVIEATGAPSALAAAIDTAAPAGRVVVVGISDREVTVPVKTIPLKELDILGSRNSLDLIGAGLDLIGRWPDEFASLISHRFKLDELAQALTIMRQEAAQVRKVLVSVGRPALELR